MEGLFSLYPILTLILTSVWAYIFFSRPSLRRELLILGVIGLFLMPAMFTVNQLRSDEVTNTLFNVSVFDLIFAFTLAGIAGTLYHALFGKHYHKLPAIRRSQGKHGSSSKNAQTWLLQLIVLFLLLVWTVILMNLLFSITLPVAFLIGALLLAMYVTSHRHDLLADALWSSFLTAFVVFLATTLVQIFTGIDFTIAPIASERAVLGVPVDLLLWSAAAGLALGPVYEYVRNLELN